MPSDAAGLTHPLATFALVTDREALEAIAKLVRSHENAVAVRTKVGYIVNEVLGPPKPNGFNPLS